MFVKLQHYNARKEETLNDEGRVISTKVKWDCKHCDWSSRDKATDMKKHLTKCQKTNSELKGKGEHVLTVKSGKKKSKIKGSGRVCLQTGGVLGRMEGTAVFSEARRTQRCVQNSKGKKFFRKPVRRHGRAN